MARFSVWRVFWAGILFAVLAQIIHTLGSWLTMGYYTDQNYFAVWSKLMMPTAGPPPQSFYLYSILFGIVGGILVAMVYGVVKNSIPGKTIAKKGLNYGLLVFLLAGVSCFLTMLLLINLPAQLILWWAVENLVTYLIGGMIIAWVMR
ncbi:MAG: hypothetical protein QW404_02135 [Candidatus Nanoarchaeia archaeon]